MSRYALLCGLPLMLFALGSAPPDVPAPEQPDTGAKNFDWPQWQGPGRNAVSKETGLLKEWPKDGPPLLWKVKNLGGGDSAPSVAAGRIIGMSNRDKDEVVWALAEADGKEQWATRLGDAYKAQRMPQGKEGPSCTPTVDGEFAYALGLGGDLVCLQVADGKIVWRKSLTTEFGGTPPMWSYRESPLVDDDKLIVTPGGKEVAIVALNKKTGEVIWKAKVPGGDGAAYSSAIAIDFGGQRQYVQLLRGGLVGVAAEDGKFLWRYDAPANRMGINITTPLYYDGQVFGTSAYGAGGGLVKLSKDDKEGVKAEEVYLTRKMQNHHGGVILLDGCLYGANGGNEGGYLACLEFKTGKVLWDERDKPDRKGVKKGSVVLADARIYYRQEDGTMILFEPSPKEYIERGRFAQPDRSNLSAWSHPIIANGKLYVRDQDVLFCYDVKAK